MRRGACPMCTGTDCAEACSQGQCYAELSQQQQAEEEYAREQEDWQRRIDEERT